MMRIARRLFCCCPAHEGEEGAPAHEALLPAAVEPAGSEPTGSGPAAVRPAGSKPAAVEPAASRPVGALGRGRPTFTPTPPAPGAEVMGPAQVHMAPVSPWRDPAGAWHATLNLQITNECDTALQRGWTLSVDTRGVDEVEEAWNWHVAHDAEGTLEGQAEERWQELHPGESANLGATLRLAEGKLEVTAARVNGLACALD